MSPERLVHDSLNELMKAVNDLGDCLQTHDPYGTTLPGGLTSVEGATGALQVAVERALNDGSESDKVKLASQAVHMMKAMLPDKGASKEQLDQAAKLICAGRRPPGMVKLFAALHAPLVEEPRPKQERGEPVPATIVQEESPGEDDAYVGFEQIRRVNFLGLESRKKLDAFIKKHGIRTRKPSSQRREVHSADVFRALGLGSDELAEASERIERLKATSRQRPTESS